MALKSSGWSRVLIANRGEIACRVIAGVQAAGYSAVAIYSDVDAGARHVALADEACAIGGRNAGESYLDQAKVLAAAQATHCDALHPGYGFLSENPEFAELVESAGIVFVGPPAQAMRLMGNKAAAKATMIEAGVPCVHGYQGTDQSDAALLKAAAEIGFPLMVKAAAGGGGRGMRRVDNPHDLSEALRSARQESLSAFGSAELILEQLLVAVRHIEIQIAADSHGNVIHLAERDCSLQRRHQKVIEEAPSPFVDAALRADMGDAAVAAARACNYVGVGTVEFLLDGSGRFSFLEMNTRLQVEHPVTEMVTGVDLVDWQLRIAQGQVLPLRQDQVSLSGHAIEARIYAEDPAHGFMPQTGEIRLWQPPAGAGVRIDHGIAEGRIVSPHYDPLLAKIICWAPDRAQARRRLMRALTETRLLGVHHNSHFLIQLLQHPRFIEGTATTDLIDADLLQTLAADTEAGIMVAAVAVVLFRWHSLSAQHRTRRWMEWSNGEPFPHREILIMGGSEIELTVMYQQGAYHCSLRGAEHTSDDEIPGRQTETCVLQAVEWSEDQCCMRVDGVLQRIPFVIRGDTLFLQTQGQSHCVLRQTYQPALSEDEIGNGQIKANLEGLVIGITAAVGDKVSRGQPLVLVEAMKMEHRLVADVDGTVSAVHITEGLQISTGQLLVELIPEGSA